MGDEIAAPRNAEVCPACVLVGMVLFGVGFTECRNCLGTGVIVDWREATKEFEQLQEEEG